MIYLWRIYFAMPIPFHKLVKRLTGHTVNRTLGLKMQFVEYEHYKFVKD